MKIKKRLDVLLTERGYADTRTKAQAIIMSGNVYVYILVMAVVTYLIRMLPLALIRKPIRRFSEKVGLNEVSALGFVGTLATNVTTFGMMRDMDDKGVVLNSAFAVSAAFTFAGHLAFTMSFNSEYVLPMIVGKLVAGVFAVVIAQVMYAKNIRST